MGNGSSFPWGEEAGGDINNPPPTRAKIKKDLMHCLMWWTGKITPITMYNLVYKLDFQRTVHRDIFL